MLVVIDSKYFRECSDCVRLTLKNQKKKNNMLMIYDSGSEIPSKIQMMKINFDYFYLKETGYIMNKQNVCFAISPTLEEAIKYIQNFKNIREEEVCQTEEEFSLKTQDQVLEVIKKLTY